MERFTGLIGIVLIFGIAFLMSNNRKAINYRLVLSGIAIQLSLAVFILKVPLGKTIFSWIGDAVTKILNFSQKGAEFVFGPLVNSVNMGKAFGSGNEFIFFFNIIPTIIFVAVLVSVAYYLGIMQRLVKFIAMIVYKLMGVSGSEALSNVASAFVGQVEAQVMIRPYLSTMTKSELLASMSGSLACISGGVLIVYVNMGAQAEHLIAASLMAAPGALVISKIVFPETEASETMGRVKHEVKSNYTNVIDAISQGAADGFKIAMNVIAMLIGFIALMALINFLLSSMWTGLTLDYIFGKLFSPLAWSMGIPAQDVDNAAKLLGQKLTVNEFLAYKNLTDVSYANPIVTDKGLLITSVALCGFANFSSVGMQIGGIGALAPERRADLAKLGMKALLCGTLTSYLSGCIAGILY